MADDRTPPPVPPAAPSVIEIADWYDNNVVVQAMIQAAYERGVAAGRKQAAADIRAHVERWENSPNVFTKELEAMRAAARIAEEPNHVD